MKNGVKYPLRLGTRLMMIPVALFVFLLVGLLYEWEFGMLIGAFVIIGAPELCTIFSKKLRGPLMEEEKRKKEDKELEKTSKWYYYLFHEGSGGNNDDIGILPMN